MFSPAPPPLQRLAITVAAALACAPTPRSTSAAEPAVLERAPERDDPPVVMRPGVPLEPEIELLLTAHRRPPPPAPPVATAERSPCHPERPNSAHEASLCSCEQWCLRTIDRQSLARRMLSGGGDREVVARWLRDGEPGSLHYPYTDTDGTRIHFDGAGKITRCSHSSTSEPGSAVTLDCAALDRREHDHAAAPPSAL